MDAWIYLLPGFAHSGSAFAVLGGVYGYDPFAGALTAAKQLKTAPEKTSSTGASIQASGLTEVSWKGTKVLSSATYQTCPYYDGDCQGRGDSDILW